MSKFLSLGICTRLDGMNGLYNQTRIELREINRDIVLERISRQLDLIIDNQEELNERINEMQEKCNQLVGLALKGYEKIRRIESGVKEIETNVEIAAYCARRAELELAYHNALCAHCVVVL